MEISKFLENLKTMIEHGLFYEGEDFAYTNDVFNHRDHLKVYLNGEEWIVTAEKSFKDLGKMKSTLDTS